MARATASRCLSPGEVVAAQSRCKPLRRESAKAPMPTAPSTCRSLPVSPLLIAATLCALRGYNRLSSSVP